MMVGLIEEEEEELVVEFSVDPGGVLVSSEEEATRLVEHDNQHGEGQRWNPPAPSACYIAH